MQKYIDEYTLLAEAKMMYQDCHESYILVEGKTDKIFFTVLMGSQSNIRFRPVSGWERVHSGYNQTYSAYYKLGKKAV